MTESLFKNFEVTKEDKEKQLRLEYRNLLTSYSDKTDIFNELIQNSWDSIATKHQANKFTEETPGHIHVFLWKRGDNDRIVVLDNGTGMSADVFQQFYRSSYSYNKEMGRTAGHKGVGAAYLLASTNHLAIKTKVCDELPNSFVVRSFNEWLFKDDLPTPTRNANEFIKCESINAKWNDLCENSSGTIVSIELHAGSVPKSLSRLVAQNESAKSSQLWANFLAANTAIGQAKPGKIPIKVTVTIIDRDAEISSGTWKAEEYSIANKTIGYPYPWKVIERGVPIGDIEKTAEAKRAPKHNRQHQAIWTSYDQKRLLEEFDNLQDEEKDLIANHIDAADIYLAYSTEMFTQLNKKLKGNESKGAILPYGIRLIVDGFPQARMLDFKLTSDIGLERQAHVTVHLSNTHLDLGRKQIADARLVALIQEKIATRLMTRAKEYRWALKINKKGRTDTLDPKEWSGLIKERSEDSIVREFFKSWPSLRPLEVDPQQGTENEVIALTSSLISGGVLPTYSIRALSGNTQYDCIMRYDPDAKPDLPDSENHKTLNEAWEKLRAIENDRVPNTSDLVVEFKVHFKSLLDDFRTEKKFAKHIELLICWSLPDLRVQSGYIEETHSSKCGRRKIFGQTHIWHDDNNQNEVPIISLKHLLLELGNIFHVQKLTDRHTSLIESDTNDLAGEN